MTDFVPRRVLLPRVLRLLTVCAALGALSACGGFTERETLFGDSGGGAVSVPAVPVTGPAASEVSTIRYRPPATLPIRGDSLVRAGTPEQWLTAVQNQMRAEGYTITQYNPARGVLAGTIRLSPDDMVDCGLIIETNRGQQQLYPAATDRLQIPHFIRGEPRQLVRTLEADGRLVVQAEPRGDRTVLRSRADYVLIKTETDNAGRTLNRELISFSSGENAAFAKGTRCQPTGVLERLILLNA